MTLLLGFLTLTDIVYIDIYGLKLTPLCNLYIYILLCIDATYSKDC